MSEVLGSSGTSGADNSSSLTSQQADAEKSQSPKVVDDKKNTQAAALVDDNVSNKRFDADSSVADVTEQMGAATLTEKKVSRKDDTEAHDEDKETQQHVGAIDGRDEQKMQLCLVKWVRIFLGHMNKYGMCVLDNFIGESSGQAILEEVHKLHKCHRFQDGQLMWKESDQSVNTPSIRSDKIMWTDGTTPCHSPAMKQLIKWIDKIVLQANQIPNNGELGKYRISGRTRLMVACYPGGGTHYVKHVDNASKDGRIITAIYYLNKNWNSQTDGGSLQIYPKVGKGAAIKIDPVFDRLVFFWSDSRNPHEVMPSNRHRYAVTVWYLDESEKIDYEKKRNLTK